MEERPSAGAMDVTSHHAESKTIKMKVKDLLRLQSIELPCFVQTDKTAYGLLGGEERVLSSLKTVTPSLQVQLPGSNPLSNGLPGRVVTNAPALVVKIVRRKKKQRKSPFSSISNDVEDVEVIYKSEVVGIVNRSISFSDPADYQVGPLLTCVLLCLYTINTLYSSTPCSFCLLH